MKMVMVPETPVGTLLMREARVSRSRIPGSRTFKAPPAIGRLISLDIFEGADREYIW